MAGLGVIVSQLVPSVTIAFQVQVVLTVIVAGLEGVAPLDGIETASWFTERLQLAGGAAGWVMVTMIR